jgi:hypothetical protein
MGDTIALTAIHIIAHQSPILLLHFGLLHDKLSLLVFLAWVKRLFLKHERKSVCAGVPKTKMPGVTKTTFLVLSCRPPCLPSAKFEGNQMNVRTAGPLYIPYLRSFVSVFSLPSFLFFLPSSALPSFGTVSLAWTPVSSKAEGCL